MNSPMDLWPPNSWMSLSPRAKWQHEHDILVRPVLSDDPKDTQFCAHLGDYEHAVAKALLESGAIDDTAHIAVAATEDEALSKLAHNNGWIMWNEEDV